MRAAELPLKGLLHDGEGHRMSPSFGYGRGCKVYRYYVSAPLQQGRKCSTVAGVLRRVRAEAIHEVIERALAGRLGHDEAVPLAAMLGPVKRIDLLMDEVRITLTTDRLPLALRKSLEPVHDDAEAAILTLPVRCQVRGGQVRQLDGEGRALILRQRRDPVLIKGLRRAHQLAANMGWNAADGSFRQTDVTSPTSAYERKLVRLAFLAPDLQRDILEGRQAPGLTLQRLLHDPLPLAWDRQRQAFGAGR